MEPIETNKAKKYKIKIKKNKETFMPEIPADLSKAVKDVATVAKDATYVVIGAGVLGFQRLQVRRQELRKLLADPKASFDQGVTTVHQGVTTVRSDLGTALENFDSTVVTLADRLEELIERLEGAVAPLEDKLPTQARDLAKQAHTQAREARTQLRSKIPTVAA